MMNGDNKRRIHAARDVLVGIIPDPKGQVEQITTALIYKYIDEEDNKSVLAGGKRAFFVGKYAKYSWQKLKSPAVDGDERLALYRQALEVLPENDKLPPVFRDMLRGAHSPFRNANVLNLFIKTIDELECSHTEDLGDAYEHLLSIMGTQGDAGQFRTPRHIIDFIVAAINPQIGERVLDPACGSGGFLVSAHNHIMAANTTNKTGDRLTQAQKRNLPKQIDGRDIDPGMARLALVNLYLHGIKNPQIKEYDTLSDDSLWHERHDIILANPPFMTPKGGIQPHDKFAVRANRSEVLFVDYISEHLSPQGRAGIIVPEGIMFQAARAYKQLRQLLIEEWGLYAVVSLPTGVFQPYSGVKTSVLLLDKTRKFNKHVLFIKIENDGFSLGAKRQEIAENDLPTAIKLLHNYKDGKAVKNSLALVAAKTQIAEDGDFGLTGERYRAVLAHENIKYPIVKLKDICKFVPGIKTKSGEDGYLEIGDINLANKSYDISQKTKQTVAGAVRVPKNTILISTVRPTRGAVAITQSDINVSSAFCRLQCDNKYVFCMLCDRRFFDFLGTRQTGGTYPTCKDKDIMDYEIPIPPLEVQERVVTEIENYQKIIDGAKQVVENWNPQIKTAPNWEMRKLEEQIETVKYTRKIPTSQFLKEGKIPIIDQSENFIAGYWNNESDIFQVSKPIIVFGDHTKCFKYVDFNFVLGADGTKLLLPNQNFNSKFFYYVCKNLEIKNLGYSRHYKEIKSMEIPCPSLSEQEKIVAEIESEQTAVDECQKLIAAYEQKIADKISDMWQ